MTTRNRHDVDSGHAWMILLAASIVLFISEGFKKALSAVQVTSTEYASHTYILDKRFEDVVFY